MSLEELVKTFIALVSKPKLTKSEQEKVRQLMKQLKEAGMTNEEISKLSKGKWTPSTVKFYSPGIKPTHPTPWDDVVASLNELIGVGFTLNDVETAVKVAENLKSHNVTLDNIIGLLFAIDSSPLEVAELIYQYELFQENGLSPEKLSEALGLREELEKMGLQLGSMTSLVELAKNYGEPEKVIEALSQYKSLIDLDQHIATANSKLNGLQEQLINKQEQIESAEANLSKLDDVIAVYEKIQKLGFGVTELTKLAALAQKYGAVTKLMDAVNAYNSYSDIQDKLNKAKADLATLKSNTEKLQTDNAHLKTAISMCQTLLKQYAFGLDAVATVFSVAEKYGSALEVLKAVGAYGKLEAMREETSKLEGAASELKLEIARLEGGHEQALDKLESLNVVALKVGNKVGEVQGELAASNEVTKLLELLNNPVSADYAEHIPNALLMAVSLRKWVSANEGKFTSVYNIKLGLENLFKELGGLL